MNARQVSEMHRYKIITVFKGQMSEGNVEK